MKKIKILLVDDEPDILEIVGFNLSSEGYKILKASSGQEAIEIAKEKIPQLILLDIMMPGMDGMETCEELRKIPKLKKTIISFLTARGEDYSQVAGYEAGADDFITKPVKPKVLKSKVKALLRRLNKEEGVENVENILEYENLTIHKKEYFLYRDDDKIVLPKKEFELLVFLASKPGSVITRSEIMETIWGADVVVGGRTIDVHIRKLRDKIGNKYFTTVKGVGYKFGYEES